MLVRRFLQEILVRTKILVARKKRLPVVPAVGDMGRDMSGKFAWSPRHVVLTPGLLRRTTAIVKKWYVAPFFLVLSACSLIDPHNMIGRQMGEAKGVPTEPVPSPPTTGLGREEREKAFDFVWGTINEHYYDP